MDCISVFDRFLVYHDQVSSSTALSLLLLDVMRLVEQHNPRSDEFARLCATEQQCWALIRATDGGYCMVDVLRHESVLTNLKLLMRAKGYSFSVTDHGVARFDCLS